MAFSRLAALGRLLLRRNRWLQIGLLIGIWWLCDALVRALGIPLPGGVVGMSLLLALLAAGMVPAAWFRRGTSGLLDHMLLFFVPATMSPLDHSDLFSLAGIKILTVILVGTVLVMAGTALAVEACIRWRERHAE